MKQNHKDPQAYANVREAVKHHQSSNSSKKKFFLELRPYPKLQRENMS